MDFQAYRSPYAGSIADLILRGGETQAQLAERIGAIRANEVAGVGGAISGIPAGWQQAKRTALQDSSLALRNQSEGLQVQQQQQGAQDDQLFKQALAVTAQNGGDTRPALKMLDAYGAAGVVPKQKVLAYQQQQQTLHDQGIAQIGYELAHDPTPDGVKRVLGAAVQAGHMRPEEAQQYADMAAQDPTKILPTAKAFMARSPSMAGALKPVTLADKAVLVDQFAPPGAPPLATNTANEKPKTRAELAADAANPNSPTAAQSKVALGLDKPETFGAPAPVTSADFPRYQAQIDAIVPATDSKNAMLRAATMARVQNARSTVDAQKAIEDAQSQIGQINVAKNTVPYKIAVQLGGVDYKPGPGGEVSPVVKGISEYKVQPLSSFAMSRPGGQALMNAVMAYNPSYDAKQFPLRSTTMQKYTTGTEGQQLNALNTAIMHMDLLASAADALKNGTFKPGNAAYNAVADAFGQAPPSSYEGIKEFLDGEVGSVVKKGVATEGEMGRLSAKGGSSASPEQMQTYIKNAMNILGGKAAVLDDKYHSVMGPADPFTAVSPRAQAILVKHGFNPANFGSTPDSSAAPTAGFIEAVDPQGQVHHAPAGTPLPAGWKLK